MSNLKNNFTSKLTSVTCIEKKGKFVYTGSFEDGTSGIIRTSTRQYASVTQIRLNQWFEKDSNGVYQQLPRTDFLFSSKRTPALGKNEQHRVIATVQINTGASAPAPVAPERVVTDKVAPIAFPDANGTLVSVELVQTNRQSWDVKMNGGYYPYNAFTPEQALAVAEDSIKRSVFLTNPAALEPVLEQITGPVKPCPVSASQFISEYQAQQARASRKFYIGDKVIITAGEAVGYSMLISGISPEEYVAGFVPELNKVVRVNLADATIISR